MRLWLVTYAGSYLGGKAVVSAKDEETARKLVELDIRSTNFVEVEVEELDTSGVIYNDNGDY